MSNAYADQAAEGSLSIRFSEAINMNRTTGEMRIVNLDEIKKTILEILLKVQG